MAWVIGALIGLGVAGIVLERLTRETAAAPLRPGRWQYEEVELSVYQALRLLDRSSGESLRAAYDWQRAGLRGRVDVSRVTSYEEELMARRIVLNDERAREMGIRICERATGRNGAPEGGGSGGEVVENG